MFGINNHGQLQQTSVLSLSPGSDRGDQDDRKGQDGRNDRDDALRNNVSYVARTFYIAIELQDMPR